MYTIKKRAVFNYVAANSDSLTAAAVHTTFKSVCSQMDVTALFALVTTAVVSTGAVAVSFWRRPVFGSTAGQVLLGTLSIPAGTAAGKVLYKEISPTQVNPGEQISYEVTTAAAGGGAAGAALFDLELSDSPEAHGNQLNMIASA